MSATIMNSATHVTHTFAFLSRDRKRRHHTPSPRQRSCALHALQQLKRLGIFVSGGGSNFRAIHESCVSGRIKGHVVVRSIALCSQGLEGQFHAQPAPHWLTTAPCQVVVTDVPTCGGAEYAMCHGIDVLTFPAKGASAHSSNATPMKSAEDLTAILSNEYKLDYILLAGYLKLVPPTVVQAFSRRMLNIHPGLLPAFGGKGMYGMNVHKAVVSSGSRCCSSFHNDRDNFLMIWVMNHDQAPFLVLQVQRSNRAFRR